MPEVTPVTNSWWNQWKRTTSHRPDVVERYEHTEYPLMVDCVHRVSNWYTIDIITTNTGVTNVINVRENLTIRYETDNASLRTIPRKVAPRVMHSLNAYMAEFTEQQ